MIFELVVLLAQNVHLSCVKISTINRQTESSFWFSLVTLEYHRLRPNLFLGLWSVWCKPCTYLALVLTLSSNGPKRDSTCPTSPISSIGCVQNDFWACGNVWRKLCSYLASRLAQSSNRLNQASTLASSPRSTNGCVQNDFWASVTFGANHAPILHRH
jgi:hypothetical protein